MNNTLLPVYGKIILSLENYLFPPEKLAKPPSVEDGLDPETEYDLRLFGCQLIQDAGILLKLPQIAMATGQVLFQRFYFSKSFVRHPMEVTAMSCVYLASKIEEAPRRLRDVINVFHHMRQIRCQKTFNPLILDQQYVTLKTQVIKAERRLLKELGFCVHVKHPHKLIVCYLQVLNLHENHAVMQTAWNYMNDSLRTEVFLQYAPETVACACIYLTARKLRIPLPKTPKPWFKLFVDDEKDIQDICRKIVKMYKRPKIDPDALEVKIDELKKKYEEQREKLRKINLTVSASNSPSCITPNSNTPLPKSKSPSPSVDISKKATDHESKSRECSPSKVKSPREIPSLMKKKNSKTSDVSRSRSPAAAPRTKSGESRSPRRSRSPRVNYHKRNHEYGSSDSHSSRRRSDSRSPTPKRKTTAARSPKKNRNRDHDRYKSKKSSHESKSKRDHDRKGSDYRSKKENHSRSRKYKDHKITNSESDDEYLRSRSSNGSYWKQFYTSSYA